MTADTIDSMSSHVIAGGALDRPRAERLVQLADTRLHELTTAAGRIREHFRGDGILCCSIVAAKVGRCSEDCAFCSQSSHHDTGIDELTALESDRVLDAARDAVSNGAESFGIVNSGLGPTDEEIERWGQAARQVRDNVPLRVCASLGILTEQQARRLAELGFQRYNHNLQTSRRHYARIVTTHSYDDRLATLRHAKAAGMSLCSGGLFGMGETWTDRLDLAFDLRDCEPDVVPINFLIPIDGTPLQGTDPLPIEECLAIVAIYRFLFPTQQIKIAGGRETVLGEHQKRVMQAGADGFLVGNYLTTCGQSPEADHRMIDELGLEIIRYAKRGPGSEHAADSQTSIEGRSHEHAS